MRGKANIIIVGLLLVTAGVPIAGADHGQTFTTLQEAVDHADPGDAILVATQGEKAPIIESATVDVDGVTICSTEMPSNVDSSVHIQLGDSGDCGDAKDLRSSTVIDASGVGPTVLDIQADDVTVQGFTLRWTVQLEEDVLNTDLDTIDDPPFLPGGPGDVDDIAEATQAGLSGVVVDGEDVVVQDNIIQLRGGPCAAGVSPCQTPVPATGVFLTRAAIGTAVVNNTIEVSLTATDGTVAGDRGVIVSGEDYTIRHNEIRFWTRSAVHVSENAAGDGAIQDNVIRENGRYGIEVVGVPTEAAPTIEGNLFSLQGEADVLLRDGAGTTLVGNAFQNQNAASTGVWIQGTQDVELDRNAFANVVAGGDHAPTPGVGVKVSTAPSGQQPSDLVLRDNHFILAPGGLNQYALTVTPDVQEQTIDARLNDWDVYTWGDVSSRALDVGVTNEILQQPFQTPDE